MGKTTHTHEKNPHLHTAISHILLRPPCPSSTWSCRSSPCRCCCCCSSRPRPCACRATATPPRAPSPGAAPPASTPGTRAGAARCGLTLFLTGAVAYPPIPDKLSDLSIKVLANPEFFDFLLLYTPYLMSKFLHPKFLTFLLLYNPI